MQELEKESSAKTLLLDSCPIITCSVRRRPKVALELTGKGYCAAKKLYYYGCKLHLITGERPHKMPLPRQVGFTRANVHDLSALKPVLSTLEQTTLIGDKAYQSKHLAEELLTHKTSLITPPKEHSAKPERLCQFDKAANELLSKAVSRVRQPIESLVNWLQEKVNIQNASKVRSKQRLILHIFGKVAAALLAYITN